MKAIIYGGLALFSAASVYGMVDYYNSSKNGTLNKIYEEKTAVSNEVKPVDAPAAVGGIDTAAASTVVVTPAKKATVKKKKRKSVNLMRLESFSRGKIMPIEEIVLPEPAPPAVKQ